ncbi:PhoH family protein [Lacihabitans sp. CCS-44]|uniref:PhoH family protein n=1 Tax=Lacihabitans sp. CCS-44 TaxID=2487331 RepID=UPI0020CEBD85|nr:PhoH family protein [Lacihabitans sp. CCS-44]MCP9757054.1 PhoH family protein [Lacihabitans sp. CCS-44]
MTEKTLKLESSSLNEFFGFQNENIKEIAKTYPQSKIISRGDEIFLKGPEKDVNQLNSLFEKLLAHFEKTGHLSLENIKNYLEGETQHIDEILNQKDIIVHGNRGLIVKAKTLNQKRLVEASEKSDIVFAIGPAGTGKTYTAVALAVRALKDKKVKKIIITRPAVEAGENLGFLPGDLKEKIDPYLRPIYDALEDMVSGEKLKAFLEKNTIEIAPLAYMRGRTLDNAFILLDEAQNTTPMQLKMFLTRMGPASKIIVTGDKTQIDLPKNQKSGLEDAEKKLQKINGIEFIELDGKDVVRHPLVVKILEAYEKADS